MRTTTFDPATITGQRWSTAGHQRMDMRMSFQLLVPCVQHHHGGRFEVLFVGDDIPERLPRRAKQQIVDLFAIPQSQRRQFVGNREHDLKIRDARQQQL